ncbi:peptidase S28 [Rostrohypoxylon terebratum]|nr:peptidase S28 [Rostrohypoxylon terebratum]
MHFVPSLSSSLVPFLLASTVHGAPYANGSIHIPPASTIPTGNPSQCNQITYYFPQKIYHNTNSSASAASHQGNNTFLQQYQIVTDFYRPGGPILFVQGAETAEFECLERLSLYDHAKELGALAVTLEHRYFGHSIPYGLKQDDPNWPTSALEPMTLENIDLDTLTFLEWVKKTVPGAEKSKIIISGGSYGGLLTIHMKNTYPDVFFGAFASSSVVIGQVSDPNDPYMYAIGNQASSVLSQMSAKGAARIKRSFEDINQRISRNNTSNMKEQYNLCTQPRTAAQGSNMVAGVATTFSSLCEYNWPPHELGWSNTMPWPVEAAMRDIDALSAPFAPSEPIRIGVAYYNNVKNTTCFDWESKTPAVGDLPYSWARCHWLKHPNAFSTAASIFGLVAPDNTTDNVMDAECRQNFGIKASEGGLKLQRQLRTSLQDVVNAKRLIVSTGEHDSITGISFPRWAPGPAAEDTKPFIVEKGGHVSDFMRESVYDREGVKDARQAELEVMKGWLGIEV